MSNEQFLQDSFKKQIAELLHNRDVKCIMQNDDDNGSPLRFTVILFPENTTIKQEDQNEA